MAVILAGNPEPEPYAAAATLIRTLPNQTQTVREQRGLTVKQAALEVGVGSDTLAGFEAGSNCTKATLLLVLDWLGGAHA